MYAIIEDSGTQFKVSPGDVIDIDRPLLDHDSILEGKSITFDKIIFVGGGEGDPKFGAPHIANLTITAEVMSSYKDKKVIGEKHNRRKRYHRKFGHRQNYVKVKIGEITI